VAAHLDAGPTAHQVPGGPGRLCKGVVIWKPTQAGWLSEWVNKV